MQEQLHYYSQRWARSQTEVVEQAQLSDHDNVAVPIRSASHSSVQQKLLGHAHIATVLMIVITSVNQVQEFLSGPKTREPMSNDYGIH